jgi:hypothetical protein
MLKNLGKLMKYEFVSRNIRQTKVYTQDLLFKFIRFKENLGEKARVIKKINNTTCEKLNKIYKTLMINYRAVHNSDLYKRTTKTLQNLLQKLGTLHEKTLVAAIVKVVLLFRKYKK